MMKSNIIGNSNINRFILEFGPSRHDNPIISDIQRLIIRWIFNFNISDKLNPKSHKIFNLLLSTNTNNIGKLFRTIHNI